MLKMRKNIIPKKTIDLLNELHPDIRKEVEIAIKQLDNGERIPHNQAIKKLKRWKK